MSTLTITPAGLRTLRRRRGLSRWAQILLLAAVVAALYAFSLMWGETFYGPAQVFAVLTGGDATGGAEYAVGGLRLPRATMGLAVGLAFGAAGVTFQTMLRNQLASPDIIGISAGASAAGVIGIVMFGLTQARVSMLAVVAALLTAMLIYVVSLRGGFSGTRLILVGIGIAAMLQSVVSYCLSQANTWDLPTATRWLTGSLNAATWERAIPVLLTCAIGVPVLLLLSRELEVLRLGDDQAAGLGVRVQTIRIAAIIVAVTLVAVATAAGGPIAFVSFMAGPIASRIMGSGGSLVLPAALCGAILVLAGDLVGQYFLGTRYPVGVVTGALGAPFLIYLLIRSNRGGSFL